MGWLYMQSLGGHRGPRQYLDAQLSYQNPDVTSRVLRSALVGMKVYYAAVEQIIGATGQRDVFAVICLVRYNPRDKEGLIFGYKDLTESMGPRECDCPEAILDLLTPTSSEYANEWRSRCRENAALRRARAAKPRPRPDHIIIFDKPVAFTDGLQCDRFHIIADPRSHRTVLFRACDSGRLYRIRNVKSRDYRLLDPQTSQNDAPRPACLA